MRGGAAIQMALESGFSAAILLRVPDGERPHWAKSVLLMAWPYSFFEPWPQGTAEVSAYYFASNGAHGAARSVAEGLRLAGAEADGQHALRLKPLGESAGLGVMGRNTLLRNEKWGSRFAMQALVTDIEPESGARAEGLGAPDCGACRRCVEACPTGALDGGFSRARCMRAHMLSGDVVPEDIREAMGSRLLGCDICQRACPHNRAEAVHLPEMAGALAISLLLEGVGASRDQIAQAVGANYAREERMLSQAAIVAGNSGDPALIPSLKALCAHPREAVRTHAEWAIRRLLRA